MDKDDDPWEILGVSRDASEADIKKAFRKGALKYHPDKQQTEEDRIAAHDIFAKLSAAYDTVNDPVKRYDWKLEEEKRIAKSAKASPTSEGKKQPVHTAKTAHQTKPQSNRPSAQTEVPRSNKAPSRPSEGPTTSTPPQRQSKTTPATNKKPAAGPRPSDKAPPPKAASPPIVSARKPSSPAPVATKKNTSSPPVVKRSSVTSTATTGPRPRQSIPTEGSKPVKTVPSSQKRASVPVTSATAGSIPRQSKTAGTQPTVRIYRDPFDIFDSFMKEEFGENYKDREDSGWKASIGVPGLSKINPFKSKSENSKKEFKKLDVNNDKTLSKDELEQYIQSHSDLWSSLGSNLNLPVKKCIEIATDVAFSLAIGGADKSKSRIKHTARELTEAEFKHFHQNYVLNAKGAHEFFLRTIFAVFDLNNDGVLNAKELDRFLDVFYKAKDIFKGDMKLPEKKILVKIVGTRLDGNKDGALQFEEIRDLLEVAAAVTTENKS